MSLSKEQRDEIDKTHSQENVTKRITVPELENILFEPLKVLDHGFVRVVDYMGDDSAIVQAARVSYGTGTQKISTDRGLIRYLMRHRHTTPFEMCEIKYHVKLPIFVARQWIRHRTANVNEYSARYSILGNEFYIPETEHLAAQSKTNRQGREEVLTGKEERDVLCCLRSDAQNAYNHYVWMLNEKSNGEKIDPTKVGLARELARMNLTLNFYTEWYWKIDLHNLLHFLSLRADSHAQYEIRAYADVMLDIIRKWVPHTYEAFMDYVMDGMHLSAQEIKILERKLEGKIVTQETSSISPREWRELLEKLPSIGKT